MSERFFVDTNVLVYVRDTAAGERHHVAQDLVTRLEAIRLEDRFKISFWDALIVHAAQSAGASRVYSEDLNDGQRYGPVEVANPFA